MIGVLKKHSKMSENEATEMVYKIYFNANFIFLAIFYEHYICICFHFKSVLTHIFFIISFFSIDNISIEA